MGSAAQELREGLVVGGNALGDVAGDEIGGIGGLVATERFRFMPSCL
jgi:hypothetical protein